MTKTARPELRDDTQHMDVVFVDSGREPQCRPNPKYPDGMRIDVSRGAVPSCTVSLPYPAPRCGYMSIVCQLCGLRTAVTVAGRRDDPREIVVPCERAERLH